MQTYTELTAGVIHLMEEGPLWNHQLGISGAPTACIVRGQGVQAWVVILCLTDVWSDTEGPEKALLSLERAGNPVCTISHLMLKPEAIIIGAG